MSADFQGLGRALMIFGAFFILAGLLLLVAPKVPWVGRLPGDILIQRDHFTFYFPLTSCLLASLVLGLVMWIIGRFRQ